MTPAARDPILAPGDQIGSYRVVRELGEGGCGIVYLAEQTEPLRREVALKVIKPGMDTRQVIARFETERQTLALMDHPNIAKVFEAGTTPNGYPYFVMELVRGVKITDFCDQHRLGIKERLHLFMLVCDAVQHAHQKGIIHRDLKPSNILVAETEPGKAGVPRVIDFGIAKATGEPLSGRTTVTSWHQLLGTPAYMSPEQASHAGPEAQDVDTRSDVYALGVLLYELLAGHLPFEQKTSGAASLDEIRRKVREEEPLKPSSLLTRLDKEELASIAGQRCIEPSKWVLRVRGDLDWIVMKCLEKDRTRRYESPNSLARDLQRHLDHEPVNAAAPSVTYRMGKLIRRNRSVSALIAVVVLLHVIIAWLSLYMTMKLKRAGESQNLALQETRQQRSNAITAAVTAQAQKQVAEAALLNASNQWVRAEAALAFATNQWLRAEARQQEAERLRIAADAAATNALIAFADAQKQHAEAERARLSASNEWARAESALARLEETMDFMLVDLSDKLRPVGRVDLLRAVAEKVLAYYQSLPAAGETDLYHRFRAARDLGQVLAIQGYATNALRAYRTSLNLANSLATREPGNTRWQGELSVCHNRLGEALLAAGELDLALEEFQQALAIVEALALKEPTETRWQSYLLSSQINLGGARQRQADHPRALKAYEAALAAGLKLDQAEPGNSQWQRSLAESYRKIGSVLLLLKGPNSAYGPCLSALQISERWATNDQNNAEWKADHGLSFDALGDVLLAQGETLLALTNYHHSLTTFAELVQADSANTEWQQAWCNSQRKLNQALLLASKGSKTLGLFIEAHEALFSLVFKKPAEITVRLFSADKRNAELAAGFRQNIDAARQLAARDPQNPQWQADLADSLCLMGDFLLRTGANGEALAEFQQALLIRRHLAEQNPRLNLPQSQLALAHAKVAVAFLRHSRPDEALIEIGKALRVSATLAGRWPDNLFLSTTSPGPGDPLTGSLPADQRAELEAAFNRGYTTVKEHAMRVGANQQDQAAWADFCSERAVQKFFVGEIPEAAAQAENASRLWQALIQSHPAVETFKTRQLRAQTALIAIQIRSKNLQAAAEAARQGLLADSSSLELKGLLALSLLLDHQDAQARILLDENKDQTISSHLSFSTAVLADYARLTEAAPAHTGMNQVSAH